MKLSISSSSSSSSFSVVARTGVLPYLLSFLLLVTTPVVVQSQGDCFNSTEAILMAQIVNQQREFSICPNTTIDIGIPADASFTTFAFGDFPLNVVLDDVTIQCGSDGKSSNNCILNGGLYQFITTPNNPFVPRKITTNNLKVSGITFTGDLPPLGGFASASLGIGAPGTNMIFDDCIFENLMASQLVYLFEDALSTPGDFPPKTGDVTISNSKVMDVTYSSQLFDVANQTLNLNHITFDDVKWGRPANWTHGYAISLIDGIMDISNCTFTNFEVLSSIVFAQGDTEFTYSDLTNMNWTIYNQLTRPPEDYCEGGLIVDTITNGIFDQCVDLFVAGGGMTNGGVIVMPDPGDGDIIVNGTDPSGNGTDPSGDGTDPSGDGTDSGDNTSGDGATDPPGDVEDAATTATTTATILRVTTAVACLMAATMM